MSGYFVFTSKHATFPPRNWAQRDYQNNRLLFDDTVAEEVMFETMLVSVSGIEVTGYAASPGAEGYVELTTSALMRGEWRPLITNVLHVGTEAWRSVCWDDCREDRALACVQGIKIIRTPAARDTLVGDWALTELRVHP